MQFPSRVSRLFSTAAFGAALLGGAAIAPAAQAQPSHAENVCNSCGTVISTHTYQRKADHGSGVGVATGAVVGGLLGNQIGSGNGRTLATVAGAVGGGYAGNEIERNAKSVTMTSVKVRMNNGTVRTFTERGNARWSNGAHVKVANRGLVARG